MSLTDQLDKAVDHLEAFQERVGKQQAELAERVQSLEQRPKGGDAAMADGHLARGAAADVLKSAELQAFRSNSAKSVRITMDSIAPKTLKTTLTNVTANPAAFRDPNLYGPAPRRVGLRSVIPELTTTQGTIDYLSVTRVGAAGQQVAEGDLKASISIATTLMHAPVVQLAVWADATRQVIDDNPALADFLNTTMLDALQREEDAQLLNGAGGSGSMIGLWTAAAGYSRGAFGGIGEGASDRLRRAITQVELAEGVPSAIVLNPAGVEALDLQKDSTGRYVLSLEVDQGGHTVLWRLPVISTTALNGENMFLVGDFNRACRLWNRQQAAIELSRENADNFKRNMVTILAEERLALTIPRPSMLVKGLLDSNTAPT